MKKQNPPGHGGFCDCDGDGKGTDMNIPHIVNMDKGQTPVPKRLRWLVMNPPEHPVLMTVTPDLAQEMLTYMPREGDTYRQRPLSPGTVKRYAAQMRAGDWRETKVPIIFTKSGLLGDGQRRLNAVLQSGVSIRFWVAFGDADENFSVYDMGDKRTAGHIFHINGVPNANAAAAATRWVHAYAVGKASTADQASHDFKEISTPQRLYNFYLSNPRLQESISVATAFAHNRMPNPSVAAALHYICAQKNRGMADDFFHRLATGLDMTSATDPVYRLRNRLTNKDDPFTRVDMVRWVMETWNAVRTRKRSPKFKSNTAGEFPRAV